MSVFKLEIVGCGSATPRSDRFHSCQLLEMRDKQFMIDCGEGAQIRLKQFKFHTNRLNHIFISHLHGDHCLGLPGLISTLGIMGRTQDLVIHAFPDLEQAMGPMINYFCADSSFKVIFESFKPAYKGIIYEDKSVKVSTIPLKHRVSASGFLFEEKPTERHIDRKSCDSFEVPLLFFARLKAGEDFVTKEGQVIENSRLTFDPLPPKKFAYISDTKFLPRIVEDVRGVDCLYHEATFLDEDQQRAKNTLHSTTKQAATIASEAGVGMLLIGHYSARYSDVSVFEKEAETVFSPVHGVHDGQVFEF